jgi:hypothetical protein
VGKTQGKTDGVVSEWGTGKEVKVKGREHDTCKYGGVFWSGERVRVRSEHRPRDHETYDRRHIQAL